MGTSPLIQKRHTLRFEDRLNKEVGRCTAFTFVFWIQDERVDYWSDFLFSFLSSIKLPSACSPLHDHDVNEFDFDSGSIEFKKAHFHVVIDFGSGNNKTIKQVFDLIRPIRDYISICPWDRYSGDDDEYKNVLQAVDVYSEIFDDYDDEFNKLKKVWQTCNVVRNMRSLLRYFKHLDNPEKHQYLDSIRSFGGFEVEDRIYSQTDSLFILDQILDYIEDNQVYSFWKLLRYCQKNNREWYAVLCRNQYSNSLIQALKSFTVENTGYLDKKIEKYEKYSDSSL